MNYTNEQMNNKIGWFNLNGTIDGGTFFGRGFIGSLIFIITLGIGLQLENAFGALLAIAGFLVAISLNICTTNKRINAVAPDQKVLVWVLALIPYISFITNIVLIASNAKRFDGEDGTHNG